MYPRPVQAKLPVWLGVGGSPESFVRAGALGLPLMVAIIGGEPHRFGPLVNLYREAGWRAGFGAGDLKVGIHALGYVAETDARAADEFFPGYAAAFTKIGRERGWPPVMRRQFDALVGERGALIVGGPETVAKKIKHYDAVLGGISRMHLQMSVAGMRHEQLMGSIGWMGREVKGLLG